MAAMTFKTLQRFFAGGFTEKEEMHLLSLCRSSQGRKILGNSMDEGISKAVKIPGNAWDPDACFIRIMEDIMQKSQ